jgi:hypothetical protein
MRRRVLAIVLCTTCFTGLVAQFHGLAAERALLEPEWNDPVIARARNNPQLAPPPAPQTLAGEAQAPLSLPRWGFAKKVDDLTSEERARSRTTLSAAVASSAVVGWPKCATKTAKTEHVRDKTGIWFTDHYNFGCLVISVSGDRAFSPALKLPTAAAAAPAADDCSNPGGAASSVDDAESDTRGRFELEISLSNLPYTITGRCAEGAEAFCRNRTAQCALVTRLIFLGGNPQ